MKRHIGTTREERLQNLIDTHEKINTINKGIAELMNTRGLLMDELEKDNSILVDYDIPNKFVFNGHLFTVDTDSEKPAYWIGVEKVEELQLKIEETQPA